MTLPAGARIGRYEILAPISSGGMGEVYRARDPALERTVAIKILHDSQALDEENVARFLREAKAASSLNHPHLLTILDAGVGLVEGGASSRRVRFIAMEYIEGKTLRRLLGDGTAPDDLLEPLAQIADGLAKAHQHGIVHRDLKPENIMITPDGFAKLLDFGVAKRVEPLAEDANTEVRDTTPGVILGTIGYMSPEQARGQAVDARSDIFSFGVILYETLTRKHPFEDATTLATLHNILYVDPPPPSEVAGTPPVLDAVVAQCLVKEAAQRAQSIRDVSLALRAVARDTEVISSPLLLPRRLPWSTRRIAAAIAIVAAVAIGGVVVVSKRMSENATFESRFRRVRQLRVPITARTSSAAIAPDGRVLAYIVDHGGRQSLQVRHLDSSGSVEVVPAGPGLLSDVTFSRDGGWIYFNRRDASRTVQTLYRVPVLGGSAPRKLVEDVIGAAAVGPVGTLLFVRCQDEVNYSLVTAAPDGGGERVVMRRRAPQLLSRAAFTPDGAKALVPVSEGPRMSLFVVDLRRGGEQLVAKDVFASILGMEILADGEAAVVSARKSVGDNVQIFLLDLASGRARAITSDLNDYRGVSVAANGTTIAAVQRLEVFHIWTLPANGETPPVQISSGPGIGPRFDWTPDGRIVFVSVASGRRDIWSMKSDGTGVAQLTSGPAMSLQPSVAHDGSSIVFISNRAGTYDIWRMALDGSAPRQLTSGRSIDLTPDISPDGRWVVYNSVEGRRERLRRVAIEGGEPREITDRGSDSPAISPDGTKIACRWWDEKAKSEIETAILPAGGGAPIAILPNLGFPIRWTPDGKAIAFVRTAGGVGNIWVQPIDGGAPRQLTSFTSDQIGWFDWSPDGKTLACSRGSAINDVVLIHETKER